MCIRFWLGLGYVSPNANQKMASMGFPGLSDLGQDFQASPVGTPVNRIRASPAKKKKSSLNSRNFVYTETHFAGPKIQISY